MTRFLRTALMAAIAGCCWVASSAAQGYGVYELQAESSFEHGCFDPCACPISIREPVKGRMTYFFGDIADTSSWQAKRFHYVRWAFRAYDRLVEVRGSGRYDYNRVTYQHRLQLDLSVDGGEIQHFDSGLVGGASKYAETIDIDISLHGEFCRDSVFRVRAAIGTTDVEDAPAAHAVRIQPNPFLGSTLVTFDVPRAGVVDVRVHDLAGRQLAVLAQGSRGAGPMTVAWDGRRSDGSPALPGLYFVRIVQADRRTTRPVVRLR